MDPSRRRRQTVLPLSEAFPAVGRGSGDSAQHVFFSDPSTLHSADTYTTPAQAHQQAAPDPRAHFSYQGGGGMGSVTHGQSMANNFYPSLTTGHYINQSPAQISTPAPTYPNQLQSNFNSVARLGINTYGTYTDHPSSADPSSPTSDFSTPSSQVVSSFRPCSTPIFQISRSSSPQDQVSTAIQRQPQILFVSGQAPIRPSQQWHQFQNVQARATCAGYPGPFVPENAPQIYRPPTSSDRARYVDQTTLENPIIFFSKEPDEYGIALEDALRSRTRRLQQRDDTVFENRGPSISLRIQWPCYRLWSKQIPTRDFRNPPGPITLAKLAKNIANHFERFIKEKEGCPIEEGTDPRWRVGGLDGIQLRDVTLISVHHVSQGSWQPVLRLRGPLPANSYIPPLFSENSSVSA